MKESKVTLDEHHYRQLIKVGHFQHFFVADISRRHQRFRLEWRLKNERRHPILMTCHYPYRVNSYNWLKICFNQSDLGSDSSLVWNFCARFSDVTSRNQWWCREMSAVSSGYFFCHPAVAACIIWNFFEFKIKLSDFFFFTFLQMMAFDGKAEAAQFCFEKAAVRCWMLCTFWVPFAL